MKRNGIYIDQSIRIDIGQNKEEQNVLDLYELNAFRLINFKVFDDTGWIKINRLTILLGENSSGKSALYQGLQMLSDAYGYLDQEEQFINLARMSDNVGNFQDICNKSAAEPIVKIGFQFSYAEEVLEYWVFIENNEHDKYGKISRVSGISQNESWDFLNYYDSINLFFLKRKTNGKIPKSVEKPAACFLSALRRFAKSFQVMAAQRYEPERSMYLTVSELNHVGAAGSNTYHMLYALSEIKNKKISMVESWLNKFGYTYCWNMNGMNHGAFMLKDLKTGIETNIVDNGFGISQSLPLALALDTLEDKILLVDSPEAFLQTKMQSEMGDLLVTGSKKGKVLLETGSEYLTLRIRRRVAEGMISNQEVSVYFIEETDDGRTACVSIKLDEAGEFQNVTESFMHFFSSDFQDIEKLDEIRRKRVKYAKENCH